nr:polysaccharide deacetylase family protein [Bacteroidota bacterium]
MIKKILNRIILNSPFFIHRHKTIHKSKLAIIGFHRVIDEADERFQEANLQWTITSQQFKDILITLKKYFTLVSPEEVLDAQRNVRNLPSSPLLITFDDGWVDNYLYAFPILKENNARALFFITTDYIGSYSYFMEEALFSYFSLASRGNSEFEKFIRDVECDLGKMKGYPHNHQINLAISKVRKLKPEKRKEVLQKYHEIIHRDISVRLFMNRDELKEMYDSGMSIGSHGKSHTPLTSVGASKEELISSKQVIENITGTNEFFLSYPHGAYNAKLSKECSGAGFHFACSSDTGLNSVPINNMFALKRFFLPSWRFNAHSGKLTNDQLKEIVLRDL